MKNIIDFFSNIAPISSHTLSLIQEVFKEDALKKGQYFIKKGEYAKEIAFLESGYVRAYYVRSEGKEYNKTFFAAPTIIGSYASLISNKRNEVAQQALTDCKIWKASFKHIELLADNIEIERLRRRIAENYFLANEKKEIEMALLDADKRYQILQKEYPGIELHVPQYHIAAYLGISATQLSRIRNKIAR
jgi:CRP-like cAMP-binding protein